MAIAGVSLTTALPRAKFAEHCARHRNTSGP